MTLHRVAGEAVAFVKGAPEEVLSRAAWIDVDGGRVALSAEARDAFGKAATVMADRGLRVLALAYRVLPADYRLADVEQDLVVTALVGFEDPPRPEVPDAVRRCREAGIKVVMATGDHPHTAVAIAREIGLVKSAAPTLLTGDDLGRMSDMQLQLALDAPEIVCARVTAEQKLRIVTAFQRKRCIVAVTGDGVNDAPALRAADIGIAMGISGTDVAREASDLVLLDDNFASIVDAVEEGRAVFENIRKFLTYILTSNIPELVPYLAFAFARVPLALTVIQILAVDLGTDMVPALGLGAEPPDSRVMQRPPRSRQDRLLTPGLLGRAYLFLGSLEAVAAMAAFFFVLVGTGWHWGQELAVTDLHYRQATTACLTAIVLMQVVNVHVCRSRRTSIFSRPLFDNALITAGIVAEVGLDSRDRLHRCRQRRVRHCADRIRGVADGAASRSGDAGARGSTQGVRPLAGNAHSRSARAKSGDVVMLNDLQAPSVADGKIVYWHRELPPLDAEPLGEHIVEADSMRVVGDLAHRDELWDQCYRDLMARRAPSAGSGGASAWR